MSRDGGIRDSIIDAIGHTPVIELRRLGHAWPFQIFAKLEGLNPGGSGKDRSAKLMILNALKAGEVDPDTVVIESSSGNMGVGLAQICRILGLRFICVTDIRSTPQTLAIMKLYGAEVICLDTPDAATGEWIPARLNRIELLRKEYRKTFVPSQYSNRWNAKAQIETIKEAFDALDGRVDFVFVATSSCGTLRGAWEFMQTNRAEAKLVAVDAVGSRIFGGESGERMIPALGAGIVPRLLEGVSVDRVIHVTAAECIAGCRLLLKTEAILGGGSSGGVISAIKKMNTDIYRGARCVVVLPDRGERYLDTIYSNAWVEQKVGQVGDA